MSKNKYDSWSAAKINSHSAFILYIAQFPCAEFNFNDKIFDIYLKDIIYFLI